MKKVFLIFLLFTSVLAISAPSTYIRLLPNLGQGYLVLDKYGNQEIDHWRTNIIERTFDSEGSYTDAIVLQTIFDVGINYQKIPTQYLTKTENIKYLIDIDGLAANGEVAAEEPLRQISSGPDDAGDPGLCGGCTQFQIGCQWVCEGPDFAWSINQYSNGSTSYLALETANKYNPTLQTGVPYYEYMDYQTLVDGCNNGTYSWMGIGYPDCGSIYLDGINAIGPLPNNGNYVDRYGNAVTGNVYGVRKGMGPWTGQSMYTELLFSNVCLEDKTYIINLMNQQNPNAAVPLYCGQNNEDFSTQIFPVNNDFQYIGCNEMWSLGTEQFEDCWTDWLNANIVRFVYRDLNNSGSVPIQIDKADLFNENGEWSLPDFTLDPGLYCIAAIFEDGTYIPTIKELTNSHTFHRERSELLDVKVLPVPIVENSFDLMFTASATITFNYYMLDLEGNQLFTKEYTLQKGDKLTDKIAPVNGIPEGILIQQFVFSDESVITIETIK